VSCQAHFREWTHTLRSTTVGPASTTHSWRRARSKLNQRLPPNYVARIEERLQILSEDEDENWAWFLMPSWTAPPTCHVRLPRKRGSLLHRAAHNPSRH